MSFVSLIEAGPQRGYGEPLKAEELTGPTTSTRIWVEDVNRDGKLDVLVGDSVTLVAPAEGLTVEEFKQRQAAWQEEFTAALEAYQGASNDEERQKWSRKYSDLYLQRSKFMSEERTGFVWLYLQK